jgi:hypothetical protein
MLEEHTNRHPNDDEIDIKELFYVLLEGKWIIIFVTTFISIIGVIFSLLLPDIYESKALLVPVNSSNSISSSLQSYGSLAGLAGINLSPNGGGVSNSVKATKKITSLSFFENNILPNIYLPDLMAVKSWDSATNTMEYDESIYNTNSNTWVINRSAQESFSEFKKKLILSQDKASGFSILSIKHQSPFIAKQWVELIVDEVNSFYRQKDRLESEKAANYLNMQISITGLTEIKQVLAELLQEETKKLALIEANRFYVFDYIDPPAVMEKKSAPSRAIICIISSLIGAMLSILLVLIRRYFFSENTQ